MKLFPDLELVVPLDTEQWTDLYFAVSSGSYDEYALKCTAGGIRPLCSREEFEALLTSQCRQ